MKKFLFFILSLTLIFLSFFSSISTVYATSYPSCSAKSMVVIETRNDTILYSKNHTQQLPMASTTKIVTAITVIENCKDLDELVKIPKKATLVEGTSIYLRENEELTVRQLLYGLMLQSGNDSAMALAMHTAGSVEKFAELMEKTANNVGVKDSSFSNPHGLDDKEHYTTAYDLAKITSYALKNQDFRDIVSTKKYNIPQTENGTARTLVNKNKLLSRLEGCVGVKTGFTSKAGRCLVSAAKRGDIEVVCVVLNCGPMFEESANLIESAFEEFDLYQILPDYNFVADVMVENGINKKVRIYSKKGFSIVTTKEKREKIEVKYEFPDKIVAPVEKEKVVGKVKVFLDSEQIFEENLFTIDSVDSIIMSDKLKDIIGKW